MDFERLLDTHVTQMKKVIRGKFSSSEESVSAGRLELFRNTQDIVRAISDLFNSTVMGQRFLAVWEPYVDNIQFYIDAVFKDPHTRKDFGDDESYRDAKNMVRKLRKNSGDIIGFFSHYLNNRDTFKKNWTLYIQRLKDSIDDGTRILHRNGSKAQFRKCIKECRTNGKAFGAVINRFR